MYFIKYNYLFRVSLYSKLEKTFSENLLIFHVFLFTIADIENILNIFGTTLFNISYFIVRMF